VWVHSGERRWHRNAPRTHGINPHSRKILRGGQFCPRKRGPPPDQQDLPLPFTVPGLLTPNGGDRGGHWGDRGGHCELRKRSRQNGQFICVFLFLPFYDGNSLCPPEAF